MSAGKSLRQWLGGWLALLVAGAAGPAAERPVPPAPSLRLTPSPVEQFRLLLATNAAGREAWLATRSASSRAAIEAKLREYETMGPELREQKLRASQLSWYLPPLMKMAATNRAAVLGLIPEADRRLIEMKLGQLSILPPPMQLQIATNHSLLRAMDLEQIGGSNRLASTSPEQKRLAEQVYPVWTNLLALPSSGRDRLLSKLTPEDRTNMNLTLLKLGHLSGPERAQAIAGFKKFAELSPAEREAFLGTAKRWQAMNEQEREVWRRLAATMQRSATVLPPLPGRIDRTERPVLLSTNGY